ncbi:hypothetical protein P775_17420 [Puniceibacterium antarcticum]|uniref:Uncharacterized protein n=1 Tax=Puniceibacterium antarcticum TaxID=1206336 RepID=A0A2G8RBG5_9RHOB|nr:hypothetical protein [Puniceibacterium antarcticum]PIL18823.1 hypothetical protein P775_17420 [Puniceibacterium antarcticum]
MAQTTMTNGTSSDYKELSDQIATLKKDLAGITDLLGDIGARRKDETIASAKVRAEHLRDRSSEALSEAQLRAADAQDQALEAIRRQPGTAIGIAVGIGFLAGFLSGRK